SPPTRRPFPYTTLFRSEPERRWRAIYALMRIGDPTAVPALIRALRDDEHRVREFAARGLAPRVADAANARQTARDALLMALEDRSEEHTSELQSREKLV